MKENEIKDILKKVPCPHCKTPYVRIVDELTPLHNIQIFIKDDFVWGYHKTNGNFGICGNWMSTTELLKNKVVYCNEPIQTIEEDLKYVKNYKKTAYEKYRTFFLMETYSYIDIQINPYLIESLHPSTDKWCAYVRMSSGEEHRISDKQYKKLFDLLNERFSKCPQCEKIHILKLIQQHYV